MSKNKSQNEMPVEVKYVVVEVMGYEIETEIVEGSNQTRKHDVAEALKWIAQSEEMLEGDEDFAEELAEWIEGIALDLEMMNVDNVKWSEWATETKEILYATLEASKESDAPRISDEKPFITMHFKEFEITTPVKLSENYKLDMLKAISYIAGEKDIIEGDMEFATEVIERINSYATEMKKFKVNFKKMFPELPITDKLGNKLNNYDSVDWDNWAHENQTKVYNSLNAYQTELTFGSKPKKAKTIKEAIENFQVKHNIEVTSVKEGRKTMYNFTVDGSEMFLGGKELINYEFMMTSQKYNGIQNLAKEA